MEVILKPMNDLQQLELCSDILETRWRRNDHDSQNSRYSKNSTVQ